jgi:hypothetical protein
VQDLGVDRIYDFFGQQAMEAREGGVIRSRLVERQIQISFEGQSVRDQVFQLGVRGDVYPVESGCHSTEAELLLQQQVFEKHQGQVGADAFLAGIHGVMAKQDGFHTHPADGVVELLHELDPAVLLQAVCQGEVGVIQVGVVFLNPMIIP